MSRYIDADKVLKELHLNHKDVIYIDKNECAERIKKIKTIDIVRCKECYMCDEEMWCSFYDSIMESDDFCSYGEREGE